MYYGYQQQIPKNNNINRITPLQTNPYYNTNQILSYNYNYPKTNNYPTTNYTTQNYLNTPNLTTFSTNNITTQNYSDNFSQNYISSFPETKKNDDDFPEPLYSQPSEPPPNNISTNNMQFKTKYENIPNYSDFYPKNYYLNEREIIQSEIKETMLKKFGRDYNINSHFDLTVSEEPEIFKYKKVKKIATPLLGHMELPENYEYKSPNLSPNGSYLSVIAENKTKDDIVFIWDMSDLYYYKYKFTSMKVDCVAFTPDSENIIIIYKKANPIMFSLKNGKKIIELKSNNEENDRKGINFAFTVMGNHFGYTSDKSFTLWSLRTGNIKKKILDNSPIKLIIHDFLVCITKDLICIIKKIINEEIILQFKIKGIESYKEIIDCRCTTDMTSFIYVIKQGIIRYVFKEKEYRGVQKFKSGVEKAVISEDCRFVVKTNMRNLSIYDIEKQDIIGTILKERFKEFRIDFNNEKLIIIDNISINIHDYTNENTPEQYIWLNKNPTKFIDAKFSNDFSILLAKIDNNNAVAYDTDTGKVIKKWQNISNNWIDFAITSHSGNKIASKSDFFLVKVWDYISGREDGTFYGFDSHSLCFSSNGNYLACGAKNGPEIARIWDIEKGTFGSFPYIGENSNFHTIVNLTYPEPNRLICCSIDQQPLIFDTNSKELLYKCECLYRFEEIYDIQCDQSFDVFLVKGRDVRKRDIGLLYRISDGILLEIYENYKILELATGSGAIISKCDNINKGQLTSTDFRNLSDPIINTFEIQSERSKLLNDKKTLVSVSGKNEYEKEYLLSNVEDGLYIGKVSFVKKTERNSQEYLTVDTVNNWLVFRYFELLTPRETMIYRKKNILECD